LLYSDIIRYEEFSLRERRQPTYDELFGVGRISYEKYYCLAVIPGNKSNLSTESDRKPAKVDEDVTDYRPPRKLRLVSTI
jgi:hypothetical protein